MNVEQLRLCAGAESAEPAGEHLLPWVLVDDELGDDVLEVGAGPEMARVLRPGGLLLGTDGEDTPPRRALHVDDVFTPIDPAGLPDRLRTAGFAEVLVDSDGDRFRFRARR
ncbi:hypothetical protein ACVGOW_04040 [Pseudonocardia saturnea]